MREFAPEQPATTKGERRSSFRLVKWYADVVDDATGELAILYHSELRWGWLRLKFFSLLRFHDGQLRTTTRFRQLPTIAFDAAASTLSATGSDVTGTWVGTQPALHERLLDTAAGYVQWDCWLPTARAGLTVPGTSQRGLGYAERLTLTLKPWRLPLHTLRWGRFGAPGHAIVWIQWLGDAPRCLVFHNGRRISGALIDDEQLVFGPYRLALTDRAPLRVGPLIKTVFQRSQWLRALFPARILNLMEAKWLTRTTLHSPNESPVTGWSVHERVEWPEK